MTNVSELSLRWHASGVGLGDCLLLHANVKRLSRELIKFGDKNPLDTILDSFLDALGPQGTLVIPLFNFDFTSGIPFDAINTPSQMGSLSEKARFRCQGRRSGHPVYSFCAFGKYADEIHAIDNESAYSDDSPFGFIRRVSGKIASLDLEDQDSMTFYHHVEEILQVDYRSMKCFSCDYTDLSGSTKLASYSIYVRNIEKGILTYVNPSGEEMWINGIYRGDRAGVGSGLRTTSAQEFFDFVKTIINSGRAEGMLYRYI